MSPQMKKSINQAHLENGTYQQIVFHLDRELKLNGLEAPDELQINNVTQQATQQNSEKPKSTCHNCKKPGHYWNQCHQLKREKDQARNNTNSAENNNRNDDVGLTNSNSNKKVSNNTSASNTKNQNDRRPRFVYPTYETCGKTNHSTEKCYFGANAANRPLPWNRRQEVQNQAQSNSDGNVQTAAQTSN